MITILTVPISEGGKPYYRLKQPLQHLHDKEDDLWVVERRPMNFNISENDMKHMDILYTNGIHPNILKVFTELKKQDSSIKLIYDIDDYDWDVPEYHPVHEQYTKNDAKSVIRNIVSTADTVISSTPKIQQGLKNEFGKAGNSELVRIAIDYDYHYWNIPKKRDTINVGWVGGAAHEQDLKLIKGIGSWVLNNFKNTKFVLGGWSSRVTAKGTSRDIYHEGKKNLWVRYLNLLFSKPCNRSRIKILRNRPPYLYPLMISDIDIMLAPLVKNPYNEAKSRIKLIEASAYSIPAVTSNISPYKQVIENGKNGFLVNNKLSFGGNTVNNTQGWKDAIGELIENEKLRKDMGKRLREKLKPIHNIDTQNQKRKKIIKNTMKK
jgi:glycosyltransferase involved in cell wall biosynthesis